MYDAIFVTPNISGKLSDISGGSLQLATILKGKGICCDILPYFAIGDIEDFPSFLNAFIKEMERLQPKIVSFYTRCDVYHIVLRMAELVKAKWPHIYVVLGGPQSDIAAEETIRQISYVDYICCGEGENTIYPFFASLLKGEPDLSVPGLVYRDGDQVVKNPRPLMMQDLDEMPFIDYSLLKTKNTLGEKDTFGIDVGRGCPFACVFCSTKSFWGRKFRVKSPQRICEEMKLIHKIYGARRFSFNHDMFTLRREMVMETCDLIKSLDFDVRWGCSARLDCIDIPLIDIMADSGMYGIYLGIETGSPRMQKLINKRLNLDNAEELVSYAVSKGIRCVTSFIYGFPEETEEDFSQTLALMARLLNMKKVTVQAHLCAFLIGTELTEKYKAELTPAQVYSDQTGSIAVTECEDLINAYPELFCQMMEYKTELRDRLKYFDYFWKTWQLIQPVYQYISESYPQERLIDMYYDYVEMNRAMLEKIEQVPESQLNHTLLAEDRLYMRFAEDENFDIISDMYRMKQICTSEEVKNGGSVTDMFCIAPDAEKQYDSLRQYPRCLAMVTFTKSSYEMRICPL